MGLGTSAPITATVVTDGPGELRLSGVWAGTPSVTGASGFSYDGSVLTLSFAGAGSYDLTIAP
jgi:hypothetical protein